MIVDPRLRVTLPWVAAIFAGLLLAASFPALEWAECAWIALAPLLIASRYAGPRRALGLGFAAGLAFWMPTLSWLVYVTVFGWLLLAAYCSLYIAAFAALSSLWFRRAGADRWTRNLLALAIVPAAWVSLEYLRSILLTGFSWNALAISQYRVAPLRQIAAWGGVSAVSAVLVVFNTGIAATVLRYREAGVRPGRTAHPELAVAFLVMVLAMLHGIRAARNDGQTLTPVQIGLVQTDIPQVDKWTEATVPLIFERLDTLTREILDRASVDLIVWPETALPSDVRYDPASLHFVTNLVQGGVPILVGSTDYVVPDDGPIRYYNSSFLFETDGTISHGYDKQHLVMFGEYIPLERWLPFMNALTPNMASFTPGRVATVFRLAEPDIPFAVLICFEDTMPQLAREYVREGARLLVNQTNDAWFERSSAPRQHMAHCVFRCVENRVPAIRCANTGVTCFIDPFGEIRSELRDPSGSTFAAGQLVDWALVPRDDRDLSFYTRHGDVFAWGCLLVTGLWIAGLGLSTLKRRRIGAISTGGPSDASPRRGPRINWETENLR